MASSGVPYLISQAIYETAKPEYDLVKIRVGREIELTYGIDNDELEKLLYKIDSEDELIVTRKIATTTEATTTEATAASDLDPEWQAAVQPIPYEVKIKTAGGTVESSMYQAAIDNDIDIRAIIELANVFQWSIDFAMDPRVGDTFKFVYEERYLDGQYVMPGQILAGEYVNDGHDLLCILFRGIGRQQRIFRRKRQFGAEDVFESAGRIPLYLFRLYHRQPGSDGNRPLMVRTGRSIMPPPSVRRSGRLATAQSPSPAGIPTATAILTQHPA